jgi:hypothetical protein
MQIANSLTAVSIVTELTILQYTWLGSQSNVSLAAVVGSPAHPIAGGGTYYLTVYLNGNPVPGSKYDPQRGQPSISGYMEIVLNTNDVLSMTAIGLPEDTAVDTYASITAVAQDFLMLPLPAFGISLASLEQIRLRIIRELGQMDAYAPSYTINGQSVQKSEYRASLWQELKECETRIRRAASSSLPGAGVASQNAWRSTLGRSPYVGGSGGQW